MFESWGIHPVGPFTFCLVSECSVVSGGSNSFKVHAAATASTPALLENDPLLQAPQALNLQSFLLSPPHFSSSLPLKKGPSVSVCVRARYCQEQGFFW